MTWFWNYTKDKDLKILIWLIIIIVIVNGGFSAQYQAALANPYEEHLGSAFFTGVGQSCILLLWLNVGLDLGVWIVKKIKWVIKKINDEVEW